MNPEERKVVIAGNWKMNHGYHETEEYFSSFIELWKERLSKECQSTLKSAKLEVRIFPPLLSCVPAIKKLTDNSVPVSIGAQNVHWENEGAYTGEVSAPMLKELGITSALVGHSERRQYFGETDETARKRSKHLLESGFHVIHCVGERLDEREAGRTEEVLKRQISEGLEAGFFGKDFVLAYEPVWAIGTGKTATPEQAQEAHAFIRSTLKEKFGERAGATSILYGGSVKTDNLKSILEGSDVDGALVGGASLKPDSFLSLVDIGGSAAAEHLPKPTNT